MNIEYEVGSIVCRAVLIHCTTIHHRGLQVVQPYNTLNLAFTIILLVHYNY